MYPRPVFHQLFVSQVTVIEVVMIAFRRIELSEPMSLSGDVEEMPGHIFQCSVAVVWPALLQCNRYQGVSGRSPQHFRRFHTLASSEFEIRFAQKLQRDLVVFGYR